MSSQVSTRTKVFISYSRKDKRWLDRLRIHLRPLERDFDVDIWDDTRIIAGSEWREEIRSALESAKVAVLLVSANFLASDFIAENELPPLLEAAEVDGASVLPLILSPCRFVATKELSKFQAVNAPERPLAGTTKNKQEEILHKVSCEIENLLKVETTTPGRKEEDKSSASCSPADDVNAPLSSGSNPTRENSTPLQSLKYFDSSDDYGISTDWLRLLQNTEKAFDILGVALGGWRRTSNFRNVLLQKARAGCKVRILFMDKDNPTLKHMIHPQLKGETIEGVLSDVELSSVYFKNLEREERNVEVRQFLDSYPNFHLTRTDNHALMIPYLYSAPWGNGPLWECGKDFELYHTLKQEFETLWEQGRSITEALPTKPTSIPNEKV